MSKKKNITTNAVRMVNAANIPFETIEYVIDGVGDNFGVKIAGLMGIPAAQCFKTLVAKCSEYVVLCVPVDKEADLKKVAALLKEKKVEMLATKDLLAVTGYMRGSVSPIGMKKHYLTYIDESCMDFEKITVSGGVCGLSIMLSPHDLIKITGAASANIIKESN